MGMSKGVGDISDGVAALPPPLVPEDCDLDGLPGTVLDWTRLRKSRLALVSKRRPEIGWHSLMLWGASWSETPACGLEDDDDILADRAMLSPERWAELKNDILKAWVKCSNGRWYHPVVAEKAKEQWVKRLRKRHELENVRIRKKHKADEKGGDPPLVDFWTWLRGNFAASFRLRASLFADAPAPVTGRNEGGEASVTEVETQSGPSVTVPVTEKIADAPAPVTGRKKAFFALKGEREGECEKEGEKNNTPVRAASAANGQSSLPAGTPDWWPKTDRLGRLVQEPDSTLVYKLGKFVMGERSGGGVVTKLLGLYGRRGAPGSQFLAVGEMFTTAAALGDPPSFVGDKLKKAQVDDFWEPPSEVYLRSEYRA